MTAANPSWREIAPMSFARRRMNLTILADGSVMAIGGTGQADSEAAAVLAGEILGRAGYGAEEVERVQSLVKKERIKHDAEAQALEDATCLAFLELDFAPFAAKHDEAKLVENYGAALEEVLRLKPSAAKGRYVKKATLTTTMGPGIPLDANRTRNLLVEEDPAAV